MQEPAATSEALIRRCPICLTPDFRGRKPKRLYGELVCKKCCYRLANRRQGAFIIDSYAINFLVYVAGAAVYYVVMNRQSGVPAVYPSPAFVAFFSALSLVLFAFRDGFGGYSLGKVICGVQVVKAHTLEPIGFAVSFVRNLPIFVLQLFHLVVYIAWPKFQPIALLITMIGLLIMALQLNRGTRWGDDFAGTKVIWKKFSHRPPFDLRGILCLYCGYNLTGNVSGVCPECGQSITVKAQAVL